MTCAWTREQSTGRSVLTCDSALEHTPIHRRRRTTNLELIGEQTCRLAVAVPQGAMTPGRVSVLWK
jgi:hypothetical protein